MNWYYVEAGQQAGPVDEAQLAELFRSGRIQNDTLVWRDGMANWEPYSTTISPPTATQAAPPLATPAPPVAAPLGGEVTSEAVCIECGRIFNIDDMIKHGSGHVCASCKPIFMQKLHEGATINTGEVRYAGFWIRFGAKFIDSLILRFIGLPVSLAINLAAPTNSQPATAIIVSLVGLAVLLFLIIGYEVFFLVKYGATPGKMACKIKVISADGGPVSVGKAFGRFFSEILSRLTCFIGYIIAAFDDEKRALHDRICATRVVYK